MSEALPYKDIQFSDNTSLETILATPDDATTGYILEVDLSFPEELHDKFKEFPPCPENVAPRDEWLSDYQKHIAEKIILKQLVVISWFRIYTRMKNIVFITGT